MLAGIPKFLQAFLEGVKGKKASQKKSDKRGTSSRNQRPMDYYPGSALLSDFHYWLAEVITTDL